MQVLAHAETMAIRWHHVVQCMCLVCAMYVTVNISAPLLVHVVILHFKKLKKLKTIAIREVYALNLLTTATSRVQMMMPVF